MSIARALARLARTHRETADALDALAAAHGEAQSDPAELVPHTRWPWSRRVSCRLARSGAIVATRSGKSWIATRGAIDAYLASCPAARAERDDDASAADAIAAVRRRFAA